MTLQVQSLSDIITNSSSELFIVKNNDSLDIVTNLPKIQELVSKGKIYEPIYFTLKEYYRKREINDKEFFRSAWWYIGEYYVDFDNCSDENKLWEGRDVIDALVDDHTAKYWNFNISDYIVNKFHNITDILRKEGFSYWDIQTHPIIEDLFIHYFDELKQFCDYWDIKKLENKILILSYDNSLSEEELDELKFLFNAETYHLG